MEHVLRESHDRAAAGRPHRARGEPSAPPSTTRGCSSTSAVTPTRTSRRSGSATTSDSSRASTTHEQGVRAAAAAMSLRREQQPAVASLPRGARVRHLGSPRPRRDDHTARCDRERASRTAGSARGRAGGRRLVVRAVGRKGLARWPERSPHPHCVAAGAVRGVRRGRADLGELDAAVALAKRRAGSQFDPALVRPRCAPIPQASSATLDSAHLDCGDRRRAGPARQPFGRLIRPGAARDRRLRRPQVAVHARARPGRGRARRRHGRSGSSYRRTRRATLRRAGLVHDLGRLGVSECDLGQARGPLGTGEWERVRLHPYLTERMLRQSEALAPLAAITVPAPRTPRRLRLSQRLVRRRDLAAGPDPRGRGRVPVDARAASAPSAVRSRGRRRLPKLAGQTSRAGKLDGGGGGRGSRRGRPSGARPPRMAGRTDGSRGRRPAPGRARPRPASRSPQSS